MAPSDPFHYVELRTFAYATEDEARVERALRTFLPEDVDLERTVGEGHHGDRIVIMRTRVETAIEVRHVLETVAGSADYESLLAELDERIDEDCSLHVQFDKQAAFRGEVSLGTGIMLRAKVAAYPARRESAIENAHEALSG